MASPPTLPQPRRGEIWFVKIPSDPPEKNPRPVVVVSVDARNLQPRAETVLAVPFSTTLRDYATHLRLQPGESGLGEICDIQAENIVTVRKRDLQPSRTAVRRLSENTLRKIARGVVLALGFLPGDLER